MTHRRRLARSILLAVALAIGVSLLGCGSASTTTQTRPVAATAAAAPQPAPITITMPGKVLGLYTGWANIAGNRDIASRLGHPVPFASTYLSYKNGWPGVESDAIESLWDKSGYRMVYAVPMFPTSCPVGGSYCWNEGLRKKYDPPFLVVAENLIRHGQGHALIRLGWEFNIKASGTWFAAGYPKQFVARWRQIVTTMMSVPGAHFVFLWNPNIEGKLNLVDFWPGSAYVGALGPDLYDWGWLTYPTIKALWHRYVYEPQGLNWFATFAAANHVPLVLPEWNLGISVKPVGTAQVGGGDDPTFIEDIASFIRAHKVLEAGLFDPHGIMPGPANPKATAAFLRNF